MASWFVTSVLLAGHLLAMNLAGGGPVIAAWLLRQGDEGAALAKRLLAWSLAGMLWGTAAGGVTLLLPNEGLRAALGRFPARAYWFGAAEILCTVACTFFMWRAAEWLRPRRVLSWTLALVAATNLLYHFPPWLAVLGRLAVEPTWAPQPVLQRSDLLALMGTSEPLSLSVHFCLASIAVPAVAAMWRLGAAPGRDDDESPPRTRTLRGLGMWALAPTLLQLPTGIWVLAGSSEGVRRAAMGGDAVTSVCFVGGTVAAFLLTQRLAMLALGDSQPGQTRRIGWLLVATVTLMAGMLRGARDADLLGNALPATPQAAVSVSRTAGELAAR